MSARGTLTLFSAALLVGGCAAGSARPSSQPVPAGTVAAPACATAQVAISFDFEGASSARCAVEGARTFTLLIGPEHAPPINPSPWYGFRYRAEGADPVSVTLAYMGAKHRYAPKLTQNGQSYPLDARVSTDGAHATLSLPAGSGIVSAQPVIGAAHNTAYLDRLVRDVGARRVSLGSSLDNRAIEGVRLGSADAPRLLVLLGRQHPPEVTGTYAMEPFVEEIAAILHADPVLAARYQVLAVPLLNPDGVAHGHWRANRGGTDLNRDWGLFTQPETRAVRDWLAALPAHIRPVMAIDFHSTNRNLFYVQGAEATPAQAQLIEAWLGSRVTAFPDYAFTVERRNANPRSGTSKNWFHAAYGIPAITYEVGDTTKAQHAQQAARALARTLLPALNAEIVDPTNGS